MNPLLMAMLQALQAQQPTPGKAPAGRGAPSGLARSMMAARARVNPKDGSLAALKPYSESDYADRFGPTPTPSTGAFQTDTFENDAFQVSGVT